MRKKRKSSSILQISNEKRQALSWNYADTTNTNGCTSQSNTSRIKSSPSSSHTGCLCRKDDIACPLFHIPTSVYDKFQVRCDCGIGVFWNGYSSETHDVVGTLCQIKLFLSSSNFSSTQIHPSYEGLPETLPKICATLMVFPNGSPSQLIFDDENISQSSTSLCIHSKRYYLCFEANVKDQSVPLESLEYLCRGDKSCRVRLEVGEYCPQESTVSIRVLLLQRIVTKLAILLQVPSSNARFKEEMRHKQQLLAFSHGFPVPAVPNNKKLKRVNFADLFQHIHEAHQREAEKEQDVNNVQHEKLIPLLRPYQVNAVRWMMKKELVGQTEQGRELHELWKTFTTVEGKTFYYNPFSAQISEDFYPKLPPSPGGIIADEMGLGKTVEVLACILNHPRPFIQLAGDKSDDSLEAEHLDDATVKDKTEAKMQPDDERSSPSELLIPPSDKVKKDETSSEDEVGMSSQEEVCSNQSLDDGHIGTDSKDDAVIENSLKSKDSLDTISSERKKSGCDSSTSERMQDEDTLNHLENGMTCMETQSQVNLIITSLVNEMCNQVEYIHAADASLHNGKTLERETERIDEDIKEKASVEMESSGKDCQILGRRETLDLEPNGEATGMYLPSNTFSKTTSCEMEVGAEMSSSPKDLTGANEDSGFLEEMDDEHSDFEADSSFETKVSGNEEVIKSDDAVVDLKTDHGAEKREGCSMLKGKETSVEVTDHNQLLELEEATKSASSDEIGTVTTNSQDSDFNLERREKILQNDEDVKSKETGFISGTGMVEMQALSNGHVGEDKGGEGPSSSSSKMGCSEEVPLQPYGIVSTIPEESRSNGDVQQVVVMETEETEQDCLMPAIAKFACLCGKVEDEVREGETIQCEDCSGWQHAKCVNWKIQDPRLRSSSAVRYLCPHCQLRQPPTKSSATLIVSPSSICQQWVEEINRHIHSFSLKILVYQGVKKHRFLQPSFLAKHDIVITTYDILKQELHYVDLPHCNSDKERKLRHAKRYMAVPSPLPAVEWWRVCLDEAQMVECHTAKAAEMALRLSAVNRWCVTGTPVQRGLNDLYGLFLFLNEDPYRAKFWWEHALCAPFANGDQEPMLKFLTKKLWRTAKKDVLDQINIPSQTEEVHWLKFSPVEAHFYKRKHQGCAFDFTRALDRTKADPSMKLSDLDRETLHRLVYPLLSLRQACCHPQAVRGEFIRFNQTTMCMEDLLQSLIAKARLECEEAQRQLVCAINGQAAMHMMEGEIVQAVEKYREVLHTSDEQKGKLKVDSLQLYHTIYNLNEILGEKHEGVAPTTRDSQLNKQMKELEKKYMSKALNNLTACGQTLFPISEKISTLRSKVSKGPGWWLDAVQYFLLQGLGDELVMKIKEDVMSGKMDQLTNRFQDCRGLQYVLQEEIDILMKCFKEAKAGVDSLSKPVTPQLVAATVDCHLRPFKGRAKNDCPFCKVEDALQEYEMRLFAFEQKDYIDALTADVPSTSDADQNNIGNYTTRPRGMWATSERHQPSTSDADENDTGNYTIRPRGTWAMSELHKILKSLHAFLKQNYGDPWTIQEGADHLELIEQMKKEFKPLRAYWGALLERVAAMDELDMAKMRLRAKLPDEPYDPVSQPYIIIPAEIPNQKMKLLNDRFVASSELRKKMGQLVYLENLEKAQYTLEGTNPDPCPICTRPLGAQWAVLHCGHCFCCECMSVLQTRCPGASMKCPVCRQKILRSDISFVSTKAKNEESSQTAIRVKGGYSTKVEAVVKALIQIRRNDPTAKSLVFSAWQEVLNIISRALTDNNVTHRQISQVGHKYFQSKLLDFKLDEDISTLLLPLNVACNGLNIIEATHVLLVEPIINPATELQAVGRVHRIGQTRPTIIHRFLVQQTIEEELHKYLVSNPISNNIGSEVSETGELTVAELRGMLSFLPDNVTD